jgi:membrane protein implicated in regulation of membrane protease activity
MLSTTIRDPHGSFPARNWHLNWQVAALVVTACSLGWMIASEKWLLVAGMFSLLLLLVRPIEVALGLYAFLIPFESMTTMDNGTGSTPTLLRYVGLLAIFVTLGVGWLRERIIRPPQTALFWSLFVLWGGVSTLWAIDQEWALNRLPTALGLWLLYMAIVSVRLTAKEFSCITLLTILGGLGASMYSAYMFFGTGRAIGRVSLAEGSTLSDPNYFAVTLLLPLSLSFGGVLSSRTWLPRGFFLAGTGVIAVAVFLTMSRGALAAVAAITIVFLVRLRLNWRLLLPVIAAGAALLFMPRLFFERMQEASTSRMSGGRISGKSVSIPCKVTEHSVRGWRISPMLFRGMLARRVFTQEINAPPTTSTSPLQLNSEFLEWYFCLGRCAHICKLSRDPVKISSLQRNSLRSKRHVREC